MTNRFRLLALLLSLALAASAAPALGQTDEQGRSMGDIMADALEDLAASIGSAQEEISDLAPGVDPSDPDSNPGGPASGDEVSPGDIDPGSPAEGDGVDPGDIDPSDPDANPGDPLDPGPAEPDPEEPSGADEPDGIELPEPSEPEEGGFAEIQLIPDPVPQAGRWKATNKIGTLVCTGTAGGRKTSIVQEIPRSIQTGRIKVRDEGRTLVGTGLAEGQTAPLKLTWDPESERFKGSVRAAAPGGRTKLKYDFRLVNQNRLEGELIADVRVNTGGVESRCAVSRAVSLKRR